MNVRIPALFLFYTRASFLVQMDRQERDRQITAQWNDIIDIIGQATLWPHHIRHFNLPYNHFNRLLVAAFVFINDLNPEVFLDWTNLLYLCCDRAAYVHFQNLFNYFRDGRYYNLYAYNVNFNQYEYLDE